MALQGEGSCANLKKAMSGNCFILNKNKVYILTLYNMTTLIIFMIKLFFPNKHYLINIISPWDYLIVFKHDFI